MTWPSEPVAQCLLFVRHRDEQESIRQGVNTMAWGILITMVTLFAMMGLAMFEATKVELFTKRDPTRKARTRELKQAA